MRSQADQAKLRNDILLNQFMGAEGFLENDSFVPFTLDDCVPGHQNTSAQLNGVGENEGIDTLLIGVARRGRLDLVKILMGASQI
jgi:hypothetical protein